MVCSVGNYPVERISMDSRRGTPPMVTQYPYLHPDSIITDFKYVDWLVLARAPEVVKNSRGLAPPSDRESMYVVARDYPVELQVEGVLSPYTIVVPKGMTTDMTSVPRVFRSIVGRIGPHLEACIIHDFMYTAWKLQERKPTRADHRFANNVLYAGLKAAKCSWLTCTAIKIAMVFSWGVYRNRDKNLFVEVNL